MVSFARVRGLILPFLFFGLFSQGDEKRITVEELMDMMKRGEEITLIDVRTPEEYHEERIPGSILIPMNEIKKREDFQYNGKIVLYCTIGVRSLKANRILRSKGVEDVVDLIGGIEAWKKAGGRVVRGD